MNPVDGEYVEDYSPVEELENKIQEYINMGDDLETPSTVVPSSSHLGSYPINAKTAREIADKYWESESQIELSTIFVKIRAEAEQGAYSVVLEVNYPKQVTENLEELGYEVNSVTTNEIEVIWGSNLPENEGN